MKKIFFLLILSGILVFCENTNDLKNIRIDQISVSDCNTSKGVLSDSIKYKTIDKNYLSIEHLNSYFNCEPGKLSVNISTGNNTILINEAEEQGSANCICPYDFKFRIGPMEYGTYNISVTKGGALYVDFVIDFASNTNGGFLVANPDI